jgi:4-amino-4-deoxy-L-arabinose transferase-like glycosyltransferase
VVRHQDEPSFRVLILLLLAAAVFFTANIYDLSLLPTDDCFYARKGVETWQRGAFYAVTWNGLPAVQNPPLPFWFLGRSFALLGENDLAARLPSVLMALGLLLITYRIGCLTIGRAAATAGVALLLLTPLFLQNARRCMLEIPTCFWISLFLLLVLEGRRRPWLLLVAGAPLAAGLLTKSLLALLPLAVLLVWLKHPDCRSLRRSRWLWGGTALGLLTAASWPIHQGFHWGWWSLRVHFLDEIGLRAAGRFSPLGLLLDYPRILLLEFEPLVIPAAIGAIGAFRQRKTAPASGAVLLAAWIVLPLVLFSLAGSRSSRYIFPLLVPMALVAGRALVNWKPTFMRILAGWIVPALLLLGAMIYWVSPGWLTRDLNAPFKEAGPGIEAMFPEGAPVPLHGSYSWDLANSLLYYAHRAPGESAADLAEVVAQAETLLTPAFITTKRQALSMYGSQVTTSILFELRDWVLLGLAEEGRDRQGSRSDGRGVPDLRVFGEDSPGQGDERGRARDQTGIRPSAVGHS